MNTERTTMNSAASVEIEIGKDSIDLDNLITAEDRLRVAMARQ
jgi:hypothetical protein